MVYEDEPVEPEDNRICSNCIGEAYLREAINQSGQEALCAYCQETGKTTSIGDLAGRIETVLEQHFELAPTEPTTALEWAMSKEYGWEPPGVPITDVIGYTASIDERPAIDVREVLEERNYDHEAAKMMEPSGFEGEAHYVEKTPDDIELRLSWQNFQRSLKTEARMFNRAAEAVLDEIFEGLAGHQTRDGRPVIVEAGPACEIEALFRARVVHSHDVLVDALKRPDIEVGPPPYKKAVAGRMNAHGVSVFYGATSAKVALAETRPPVGSKVIVGRFELLRSVRLLDVEALRSVLVKGSLFDESFAHRLAVARFLERLSHRITIPVLPDDEPFEYLVTQAIADYLAGRRDPALDGIIYPSIQVRGDERNIVLFHKAARVAEFAPPEGSEIVVHTHEWDEDGPTPDYVVWEKHPPEAADDDDDDRLPRLFDLFPEKADSDMRDTALQLDTGAVTVHHVEAIEFATKPYKVTHRRDKH